MKLNTDFSKDRLIDVINQSNQLGVSKKELLLLLLNLDSNFLHFSFGLSESDKSIADWDYIYTEIKNYFIPALLNSNWYFSFGSTWLEEKLFIVFINFEQREKLNDFLFNGAYQKDIRKEFDLLEIYLTEFDMKKALENELIKDEKIMKMVKRDIS